MTEKEELNLEQQVAEEPESTSGQTVSSDSTSGKEKGDDEQQNTEDSGPGRGKDPANAKEADEKPTEDSGPDNGSKPKEADEEPTAKPVAKQPRKFRCFDPTGTVDIHMGNSGISTKKPVTIPEFFRITFDKMPDTKAVCWKDKKEDPWQSLTYIQYKNLIYNVAKSFLKVVSCCQ